MIHSINRIDVRRSPSSTLHHGLLSFAGTTIPCALGRSGVSITKREGDGATPAGSFRVLFGYFRADKITPPSCLVNLSNITNKDGWCDDPASRNYNQPVKLPIVHSHEIMKRADSLYDICLVLDYNFPVTQKYRGSAIFFHLAKDGYQPTEGCVAIDWKHMMRLLPLLRKETKLIVHP